MRNFLRLSSLIAFTVLGVILFQGQDSRNNTRWDDPVLDRKPFDFLYMNNINPPGAQIMAVQTDANGFDNFDLGNAFGESQITTSPMDPLRFFTAYNGSGSTGTQPYASSDGGITWTTFHPTWAGTMFGDPSSAFDSLGILYHENMTGSGATITGTKIARSTSGGFTWVGVSAANSGNDKNWIAADQTGGPYKGYVYSAMTNFSSCNVVRSTDGGVTFNFVASLTPHGLPGAMPCVGPNGNIQGGSVYVVTNAGSSFSPVYTFFRSTDGGVTFNTQSSQNFANCVGDNVANRNSVQNMRTRPYPFISADNSYGPNRGKLYLVYASNDPVGCGNKSDIYCRSSSDFGVNWSAPVVVNDDASSQNNYQWHPAMWCDKETGTLHVSWMDTRNYPLSDTAEIYATYSTNGGATFVPNVKISTGRMKINCGSCPGGGTPRYQGDYNSVASNSLTAMHNWTDFRFGGFGSFAAYFPDYAMKTRPNLDTLSNPLDTSIFWVSVPAVKNYTGRVKLTSTISPAPVGGTIVVNFLNRTTDLPQDSLTSYPDSLKIRVVSAGAITPGLFTININANGNNGTPAHRRTIQVRVINPIGIEPIGTEVPSKFNLFQNYPNPFNPVTNIKFDIAKSGLVKLMVYDITGRQVAELVNGTVNAGKYQYNFSASNLASGIYFYKLETPEFTGIKKMILVK